jgi:hypothetical protein
MQLHHLLIATVESSWTAEPITSTVNSFGGSLGHHSHDKSFAGTIQKMWGKNISHETFSVSLGEINAGENTQCARKNSPVQRESVRRGEEAQKKKIECLRQTGRMRQRLFASGYLLPPDLIFYLIPLIFYLRQQ